MGFAAKGRARRAADDGRRRVDLHNTRAIARRRGEAAWAARMKRAAVRVTTV